MHNPDNISKRLVRRISDSEISSTSTTPINLTNDLSDLDDEQREFRLQALKGMLANSEARQQQAQRNKPPAMAIGQQVVLTQGDLIGRKAVVLDADFIKSRVQLAVDGEPEPLWVSFKWVGKA